MTLFSRRALPLAVTQCAAVVSVACVWSAARGTASQPKGTREVAGAAHATASPDWTPTQEPAPRRTQPLPTPAVDERAWLDEWRELITMTTRKATTGC